MFLNLYITSVLSTQYAFKIHQSNIFVCFKFKFNFFIKLYLIFFKLVTQISDLANIKEDTIVLYCIYSSHTSNGSLHTQ
jgi:hypothetical protein